LNYLFFDLLLVVMSFDLSQLSLQETVFRLDLAQ
jgi:hypothetical protein